MPETELSREELLEVSLEIGKEIKEDCYTPWRDYRNQNYVESWNGWFRHFMNRFYGDHGETAVKGEGKDGRSRIFLGLTKNKVCSIVNKSRDIYFSRSEVPLQLYPTPEQTIPEEQAKAAAEKMDKASKDQLIEMGYESEWTTALWLAVIFGTVIGKCNIVPYEQRRWQPFFAGFGGMLQPIIRGMYEKLTKAGMNLKKFTRWEEVQEIIKMPHIEAWDIYQFIIDPKAKGPQEGKGLFFDEFLDEHGTALQKRNGAFFEEVLDEILADAPPKQNDYAGKKRDRDLTGKDAYDTGGYLFSEYWGLLKKEYFEKLKIEIEDDSPSDWVEGSITLAQAKDKTYCARIYENTIKGPYRGRRPCLRCVYEEVPLAFYGRGAPEDLFGEQKGINSGIRLVMDNKFTRGQPPIFMDRDYVDEIPKQYHFGEVYEVEGVQGQWERAFKVVEFPDLGESIFSLLNYLKASADEATVPAWSAGYGEQAKHRTLGGLSILFGSANVHIKAFLMNYDAQWVEPAGKFLYHFNMAYHQDESIKGDFECRALGVRSFMAKEVYLSKFLEFMRIMGSSIVTPLLQGDAEMLYTLFVQLCEGMEFDKIKEMAERRVEKIRLAQAAGGITGGRPTPPAPDGRSPPPLPPDIKGMPQEGDKPIPAAI